MEKKQKEEISEILQSMSQSPVPRPISGQSTMFTPSVSLHSKVYRTVFYRYLIEEGLKNKDLRKKFNKEWLSVDDISRKTKINDAEMFFDSIL